MPIPRVKLEPRQHPGLPQLPIIQNRLIAQRVYSTYLEKCSCYARVPVGVAVRRPQRRFRLGLVDGLDAAGLQAAFEDRIMDILQAGGVDMCEVVWHVCIRQESGDAQVLAGDGG